MIVLGGSVTNCLLHIPEKYAKNDQTKKIWFNEIAYADSDIDVFIYGLNEQQYKEKLVNSLNEN